MRVLVIFFGNLVLIVTSILELRENSLRNLRVELRVTGLLIMLLLSCVLVEPLRLILSLHSNFYQLLSLI